MDYTGVSGRMPRMKCGVSKGVFCCQTSRGMRILYIRTVNRAGVVKAE